MKHYRIVKNTCTVAPGIFRHRRSRWTGAVRQPSRTSTSKLSGQTTRKDVWFLWAAPGAWHLVLRPVSMSHGFILNAVHGSASDSVLVILMPATGKQMLLFVTEEEENMLRMSYVLVVFIWGDASSMFLSMVGKEHVYFVIYIWFKGVYSEVF